MTIYNFTPALDTNFQFAPTLDGQTYNVIVTWNLFGERFYVNVYTLQGALVVSIPLIGSPPDYDINIVGGYFETSTLVYRAAARQFEVLP